MKRSKLLALLGSAVLSVGVVGLALATELKEAHQGITVTWDADGNPVVDGFTASESCDEREFGEGQLLFHFVENKTVALDPVSANTLDVWLTGAADVTAWPADSVQGNGTNVDWWVLVDATDSTVTLDTAISNISGADSQMQLSALCVGDNEQTESSSTTSFESSEASTTEETSSEETSSVETTTSFESSEESTTEETSSVETTTSFESSEESTTDSQSTTSFESSNESTTDSVTQPSTDTVVKGAGQQSGGLWMLLAALGVLAGSVIVLAPSKAKAKE